MEIRYATINDIDKVLKLHSKYQVDTIREEDKSDGFVTTSFTKDQLTKLIVEERGLFIAVESGEVVAYVMAASWHFWSSWPMFRFMIKGLNTLSVNGEILSLDNSYQYGPVCLDRKVRNSGLLEKIFTFAYSEMSKKYPYLITFVNKNNPRSYEAHSRKLGLQTIHEFSYNNNQYYEMCYFKK